MDKIEIIFKGPFSFSEKNRSLFQCRYNNSQGIYLWTFKTKNGYMIHYVGETTRFAKRHREHLINILGLNYGIFDPECAKNGELSMIWKGLWREKTNDNIIEFLALYSNITNTVINYIESIDIFFAEINVEENIRKHIEGTIGWNLRNNQKAYKSLYPDDNHVGTNAL
jgi:hypothetical protein